MSWEPLSSSPSSFLTSHVYLESTCLELFRTHHVSSQNCKIYKLIYSISQLFNIFPGENPCGISFFNLGIKTYQVFWNSKCVFHQTLNGEWKHFSFGEVSSIWAFPKFESYDLADYTATKLLYAWYICHQEEQFLKVWPEYYLHRIGGISTEKPVSYT